MTSKVDNLMRFIQFQLVSKRCMGDEIDVDIASLMTKHDIHIQKNSSSDPQGKPDDSIAQLMSNPKQKFYAFAEEVVAGLKSPNNGEKLLLASLRCLEDYNTNEPTSILTLTRAYLGYENLWKEHNSALDIPGIKHHEFVEAVRFIGDELARIRKPVTEYLTAKLIEASKGKLEHAIMPDPLFGLIELRNTLEADDSGDHSDLLALISQLFDRRNESIDLNLSADEIARLLKTIENFDINEGLRGNFAKTIGDENDTLDYQEYVDEQADFESLSEVVGIIELARTKAALERLAQSKAREGKAVTSSDATREAKAVTFPNDVLEKNAAPFSNATAIQNLGSRPAAHRTFPTSQQTSESIEHERKLTQP